jgi:hypothetical protein
LSKAPFPDPTSGAEELLISAELADYHSTSKKGATMSVKVFDINQASNIERTIQAWLNANLGIKIVAMSQSATEDTSQSPSVWYYQIVIIYTP